MEEVEKKKGGDGKVERREKRVGVRPAASSQLYCGFRSIYNRQGIGSGPRGMFIQPPGKNTRPSMPRSGNLR